MEPNTPNVISRPGQRPEGGGVEGQKPQNLVEKIAALPTAGKVVLGIGGVALLWLLASGGGESSVPQGQPNMGAVGGAEQVSPTASFTALESDRPALIQNVFEQNRRDMSELRGAINQEFTRLKDEVVAEKEQNLQIKQQMQQMMDDFRTEVQMLQQSREQDAARLAQLADQQRQMELGASVGDATMAGPVAARRQPIRQTSLGAPPLGFNGGAGVFSPLAQMAGVGSTQNNLNAAQGVEPKAGPQQRPPFIPPLGFVEATLLNGVDALVSGEATPALARISGNYTTAMNSTVHLDGCVAMLEFNGNIATERAVGKPVRMTCVFPDGGAATYELSGYVVDAEDGVIGVPGLLYEGDPTRIAASMMADFLAGVGAAISDNQTTSTVDSDGTERKIVTGDQARSEIASGVDKAFSSIRDYLKQRVDRTTPFIRLDAMRTVNLVILSGQELRGAGSPWTLLFDGNAADNAAQSQQNATQ